VERAARPRESRALTVPGRQAEGVGHLLHRQVGQVVQRDHLALAGRKLAERLKQDNVAVGVTDTRLIDEPRSETDQSLRPPPPAAGEVDRDRPEPGLRIVGAKQPRGMVEPTHERLLDHLLGLRHAAGHANELPEQAPVRRGVQLLDLDVAHPASPFPSERRLTRGWVRLHPPENSSPSTEERSSDGSNPRHKRPAHAALRARQFGCETSVALRFGRPTASCHCLATANAQRFHAR
jgi:hypothetical protein